jgi:hypothetical protein
VQRILSISSNLSPEEISRLISSNDKNKPKFYLYVGQIDKISDKITPQASNPGDLPPKLRAKVPAEARPV